jgi:1-aminocyclopropane-1-carboxylate deaminase/D-cysteine desulfhydrase-like pyridoxal-dependent ACC family enzyme
MITAVQDGTIFPEPYDELFWAQGLWIKWLKELTPVQRGQSGVYYKREDWFAPCGYGGINGSKLRQCMWLLDRAKRRGHPGVVGGGSVKSPQHAMAATVAKHLRMKALCVLGATKPETCTRHDSVAIAKAAGARFDFIKVGYNVALQKRVRDLVEADEDLFGGRSYANWYPMPYAISIDEDDPGLVDFHSVGAWQASNIPLGVRTVLLPAGSCNTAVGVLLGIARHALAPLGIHLMGIGHNRVDWLLQRLRAVGLHVVDMMPTDPGDRPVPSWAGALMGQDGMAHMMWHYDLVDSGYTDYQQMWKESMDGVVGHPTYEAKCFRWLKEEAPTLLHPDGTLFWVVGSEPKLSVMEEVLR